jgi:hypothetical protein
MATIIKLKRSESALAVPTVDDLAVGELAINTADRLFYIKKSNNEILPVANYVDIDTNEINSRLDAIEDVLTVSTFPTGDYGNLSALSLDAFGISVSATYDCLNTPIGAILDVDLGAF